MSKISKPNGPWELPKLAVHLSEREVVSTVLFFMVPNKSSLFREGTSAQLIFQAGSEHLGGGLHMISSDLSLQWLGLPGRD